MVGWLVIFYGISTLVDYLMPNPVHTYILNIKKQTNKKRGVMVIVVGNGHGDTSSSPGQG